MPILQRKFIATDQIPQFGNETIIENDVPG
jgi:hypothetical protein